jgi:hypothetical protein
MPNRITLAIARMEKQIADRVASGATTIEGVAHAHKSLDMDLGEFARFQTLKTLAVSNGRLSPDEGQTVYALLGNTPSVFNARPAAVKAVLTGLFRELLEANLRDRGCRLPAAH